MMLSAFILAAGLGERLLPITHYIPKPLLPILGKPVLESVLEKITSLSIYKIGLNLHHKKRLIEDWIKLSEYSKNVTLFHEDHILGTGGALKNAEGFLKKSPFLVHNADILSDIDLSILIDTHVSSGNIATLAVHDYPEFNRLILDNKGFLKDIVKHPRPFPPPSRRREVGGILPSTGYKIAKGTLPSTGGQRLTEERRVLGRVETGSLKVLAFTGIAVYQPEFLQFLPDGNSSVVDAWFRAVYAGHRIGTMDVTGCYWTDIGTPDSYVQAVIHEMRQEGESVYIHPSVATCSNASLDGYIVIEKDSVITRGVCLKNCISLPGATIGKTPRDVPSDTCFLTMLWGGPNTPAAKKTFENCIVGPDFIIQLGESDFGVTEDNDHFFIGTGGSDRKYYRVRTDERSAVLMQCAENDPDFLRHIAYTSFFRKYAVPVPELLNSDNEAQTALFEDLGDMSLYSYLKCPRPEEQIEKIYRRTLDILVTIQTTATDHVNECPLLQERFFDYEHLRWETVYFLERFVQDMMRREIQERELLESEFHQLASLVDSFSKTIVHRDFQSQNIMISRDGMPRILDYQGARLGPPAYDVVSLLWDPYHRLENDLREDLLDYYMRKVSSFSSFWEKFRNTLLPCRLQRHMQALGAYGFLSRVKGKKYFEKHVPEGIRLLKEDIIESGDAYPTLRALVMEL